MKKFCSSGFSRYRVRIGFSILELLTVLFIIGLLIYLSRLATSTELQYERIRLAATTVSGWLEEIRNNALNNRDLGSAGATSDGCVVTFQTPISASASSAGTVIATAPSTCSKTLSLRLPGLTNKDINFDIAAVNDQGVPISSLTFTPRGSVTSTSDLFIKIYQVGTTNLRCIRISSILGLIRIGSANATSVSQDCNDWSNY